MVSQKQMTWACHLKKDNRPYVTNDEIQASAYRPEFRDTSIYQGKLVVSQYQDFSVETAGDNKESKFLIGHNEMCRHMIKIRLTRGSNIFSNGPRRMLQNPSSSGRQTKVSDLTEDKKSADMVSDPHATNL